MERKMSSSSTPNLRATRSVTLLSANITKSSLVFHSILSTAANNPSRMDSLYWKTASSSYEAIGFLATSCREVNCITSVRISISRHSYLYSSEYLEVSANQWISSTLKKERMEMRLLILAASISFSQCIRIYQYFSISSILALLFLFDSLANLRYSLPDSSWQPSQMALTPASSKSWFLRMTFLMLLTTCANTFDWSCSPNRISSFSMSSGCSESVEMWLFAVSVLMLRQVRQARPDTVTIPKSPRQNLFQFSRKMSIIFRHISNIANLLIISQQIQLLSSSISGLPKRVVWQTPRICYRKVKGPLVQVMEMVQGTLKVEVYMVALISALMQQGTVQFMMSYFGSSRVKDFPNSNSGFLRLFLQTILRSTSISLYSRREMRTGSRRLKSLQVSLKNLRRAIPWYFFLSLLRRQAKYLSPKSRFALLSLSSFMKRLGSTDSLRSVLLVLLLVNLMLGKRQYSGRMSKGATESQAMETLVIYGKGVKRRVRPVMQDPPSDSFWNLRAKSQAYCLGISMLNSGPRSSPAPSFTSTLTTAFVNLLRHRRVSAVMPSLSVILVVQSITYESLGHIFIPLYSHEPQKTLVFWSSQSSKLQYLNFMPLQRSQIGLPPTQLIFTGYLTGLVLIWQELLSVRRKQFISAPQIRYLGKLPSLESLGESHLPKGDCWRVRGRSGSGAGVACWRAREARARSRKRALFGMLFQILKSQLSLFI